MSDIIDINITPVIEEVTLTIEPNLTTININTMNGGGSGVQSVVAGANISVNNTDPNNPIVSATGLVPYTGATSDVNLGEFGLLTGNIEFDNTPTNIPTNAGSAYWNDTDGTLDLILKGGNVKLQVGQEQVVRVVNKTATNVNLLEANYQAVRVTGAIGQRLKVDLAQATSDLLSAETIGLVTETINNNQEGFITTSGLVRNINTTGSLQGETWADGDIIYLSPTVAGSLTKVKPVAPNHLVIIGYVIHSHITQGTIFVKVDNGYELDELHNVDTTESKATPIDADSLLLQDTADNNIWKKLTLANLKATLKTYFNGFYQLKMIKQGYTTLTGVTGIQVLASLEIPADWIASGDGLEIILTPNKSATAASLTFAIYHDTTLNGTSNSIATTTALSTSQRSGYIQRVLVLDGTTLRNSMPITATSLIPISGGVGGTTTFTPTVANYITLTVNPTVGSEVSGFNQFYIRKL